MDGEYLPKDTLCSAVFSRVVSLSSDWILDIVGGSADGSDRALFSSFVQDFFWEDTSSSTIDFLFNGHSSRGNTKIKDHKVSMIKASKKKGNYARIFNKKIYSNYSLEDSLLRKREGMSS